MLTWWKQLPSIINYCFLYLARLLSCLCIVFNAYSFFYTYSDHVNTQSKQLHTSRARATENTTDRDQQSVPHYTGLWSATFQSIFIRLVSYDWRSHRFDKEKKDLHACWPCCTFVSFVWLYICIANDPETIKVISVLQKTCGCCTAILLIIIVLLLK